MTNVTQRLMLKDGSLVLHNEGHWDQPLNPDLPGYTSFNDAGVETETGEFLYSLIRVLKPSNVLETGTHWGVGAAYMGQALLDNNHGHLDTIEFDPANIEKAKKRMVDLQLSDRVQCHFGDARTFTPSTDYGFILLDTEPQTRFGELVRYFPRLAPGGFVFIHDLHCHMHQIPNEEHGFAWPFGEIPEQIKTWVKDDQLRPFHFPTPRGLTGFYKPKAADYQWQR